MKSRPKQAHLFKSALPISSEDANDRLVCSKRMLVLTDLVHFASVQDHVSTLDYERITGLQPQSASKSLERLRKWLRLFGVHVYLEQHPDEQYVEIVFDRHKLRRFVEREEAAALKLLRAQRNTSE